MFQLTYSAQSGQENHLPIHFNQLTSTITLGRNYYLIINIKNLVTRSSCLHTHHQRFVKNLTSDSPHFPTNYISPVDTIQLRSWTENMPQAGWCD